MTQVLARRPAKGRPSPMTPKGVRQPRSAWGFDYMAPEEVFSFDTFEAAAGQTQEGVIRVYAGNGRADDPLGAAFDFRNGSLIGFGVRVDEATMAGILQALADFEGSAK